MLGECIRKGIRCQRICKGFPGLGTGGPILGQSAGVVHHELVNIAKGICSARGKVCSNIRVLGEMGNELGSRIYNICGGESRKSVNQDSHVSLNYHCFRTAPVEYPPILAIRRNIYVGDTTLDEVFLGLFSLQKTGQVFACVAQKSVHFHLVERGKVVEFFCHLF